MEQFEENKSKQKALEESQRAELEKQKEALAFAKLEELRKKRLQDDVRVMIYFIKNISIYVCVWFVI